MSDSWILDQQSPRAAGTNDAPLRFGEGARPAGTWRGRRLLLLDGEPAFELSFWCGTCPFLFQRLQGANRTLSITALQQRLDNGLQALDDDVIDSLSMLLPAGEYLPMLEQLQPRLVMPMRPGDYFSEDQVATWGIDGFWGLPQYPRTPYYRGATRKLGPRSRLHEFIVPMVPPSWNDASVVAQHAQRLAATTAPTCLAVSILDICQPADWDDERQDGLTHWGLAHFLLDGHHKLQAAAENGGRLRLLTLLSVDHSLADRADVLKVPAALGAT